MGVDYCEILNRLRIRGFSGFAFTTEKGIARGHPDFYQGVEADENN
jgi:hypothetical protein